jgi:uncharacterized protein YaaR (DUF327 family)
MLRFRTVVPRSRYSAAAAAKSISKPSIPSQNTGDTDKEQRIESFFSSFNAERQRMEKDRRESLKRLQESLHSKLWDCTIVLEM